MGYTQNAAVGLQPDLLAPCGRLAEEAVLICKRDRPAADAHGGQPPGSRMLACETAITGVGSAGARLRSRRCRLSECSTSFPHAQCHPCQQCHFLPFHRGKVDASVRLSGYHPSVVINQKQHRNRILQGAAHLRGIEECQPANQVFVSPVRHFETFAGAQRSATHTPCAGVSASAREAEGASGTIWHL